MVKSSDLINPQKFKHTLEIIIYLDQSSKGFDGYDQFCLYLDETYYDYGGSLMGYLQDYFDHQTDQYRFKHTGFIVHEKKNIL